MTTYRHANVRGQKLFYREAGSKDSPIIVLLHGFPSSSHMFRDLIPQLADKFHLIAPDYVGFGYSDAPSVQDYGAPVGYRIASIHPDAIQGIVVQNGNAYVEGIGGAFDPMKRSGPIATPRPRSPCAIS